MLVALASFVIAGALLIVLPGPDNTVVLRSVLHGGRSRGARTAAGACCGLLVWMIAAAAGLSALLQASRTGYDVVKIVGAVYLAWLGVRSLLASRRREAAMSDEGEEPSQDTGVASRRGFLLGITTDLLNPKVGVFFVTFLPQFIPASAPVTPFTLLFGGMYVAGTAVWFVLLVRLASRGAAWLRSPRVRQWLERVTGVVLIGFAVRLATESR